MRTIEILEKSKVTTVNKKRFSVDAGLLTTNDYYGHATVDFWGPLVIGVHGQIGTLPAFGVGLGLRF